MIVVKLIGGLGNQMFQYALGRHLALKNNTELKLDITGFEEYKLHAYSLHHLNIKETFATQKEISAFRKYQRKSSRAWFWYNRVFADRARYAWEKQFNFEPWILSLKDPVYLDGYWQSERYFKEIEPTIRDEFRAKEPLAGKNKELGDLVLSVNATSLHVRRADYVTNPLANVWNGTCDVDYYVRAISTIASTVENPHFFVFSDDIEWARQKIPLDHTAVYVDHNNAATNYEDLRLMSLCKHNIIANSTFSWWGAWLNNNPDKVVIAPQKWFQTPKMDTRDLVPDTWITL